MREALSLAMASCTLRNQFIRKKNNQTGLASYSNLEQKLFSKCAMISGDIPDSCQSTSGVVVQSIPSHFMSSTAE